MPTPVTHRVIRLANEIARIKSKILDLQGLLDLPQ